MKTIIHKGERFYADTAWDDVEKKYYAEVYDNNGVTRVVTGFCMSKGGALLEARKCVKALVEQEASDG